MAARAQRSAPTYFTLKSCSRSSSTTVSIGPVALAEPQAAEALRGLGHRAIDLLSAGHVGDQRDDRAARLARQLARRGLEPVLRAGDDRHVDALAGELERDRLADAEAAAGH